MCGRQLSRTSTTAYEKCLGSEFVLKLARGVRCGATPSTRVNDIEQIFLRSSRRISEGSNESPIATSIFVGGRRRSRVHDAGSDPLRNLAVIESAGSRTSSRMSGPASLVGRPSLDLGTLGVFPECPGTSLSVQICWPEGVECPPTSTEVLSRLNSWLDSWLDPDSFQGAGTIRFRRLVNGQFLVPAGGQEKSPPFTRSLLLL